MKKFSFVLVILFCFAVVSYCKDESVTKNDEIDIDYVVSSSNVVVNNILNRKSVRRYSDKKVEQEKIDTILKCAMAAPSAMNKQPWELLVIDNKETMNAVADAVPNAVCIKNASIAIIVCGNKTISEKFWEQDCCAVTENILLAVESLELGAVWCAVYPFEDKVANIQKLFNLPEDIVPLNVIPIGYLSVKEYPKQKYNAKKIHLNKW